VGTTLTVMYRRGQCEHYEDLKWIQRLPQKYQVFSFRPSNLNILHMAWHTEVRNGKLDFSDGFGHNMDGRNIDASTAARDICETYFSNEDAVFNMDLIFLNACYSEKVGVEVLPALIEASKKPHIIAWEGPVPNDLCNLLAAKVYRDVNFRSSEGGINSTAVWQSIEEYCREFVFENGTFDFRGVVGGDLKTRTYTPKLLCPPSPPPSPSPTLALAGDPCMQTPNPKKQKVSREFTAVENKTLETWIGESRINKSEDDLFKKYIISFLKSWAILDTKAIVDIADEDFNAAISDMETTICSIKSHLEEKIDHDIQLGIGKNDFVLTLTGRREKTACKILLQTVREELLTCRYHHQHRTRGFNMGTGMSNPSMGRFCYTSVDDGGRSHRWADSALRVLFSSPTSGEKDFQDYEQAIVAEFVFAIALENDSTSAPEKDATFIGNVSRLDAMYPSVSRLLHPSIPPSIYPFLSAANQLSSRLVCETRITGMDEYRAFVSRDSYKDIRNVHGAQVVQDVWCASFRVQGTQEDTDAVSSRVMSMFTLQFAVGAVGDAQVDAHVTLAMKHSLREVLREELNRVDLFGEEQIGMGHANVDGTLTLLARVRVSNVYILQYLRDLVLNERDFSKRIQHRMAQKDHGTVKLNTGSFLESYERALYSFDRLTPEQVQVHMDCAQALRQPHTDGRIPTVRIDGAAGTGKTFLALHELLLNLRQQDRQVLFVARNTALCYFAAGWAYRRLRLHMSTKQAMAKIEQFWTLSLDLDKGEVKLRKCKITEQTSDITFVVGSPPDATCPKFELVVVDEAHHVYGYHDKDEKAREFCDVMEQCCQGCAARFLFSDVSQSIEGIEDAALTRFPLHTLFNMDVVVRSTERVVLGAMVCIHPCTFPT
jgi:hypothetical protein